MGVLVQLVDNRATVLVHCKCHAPFTLRDASEMLERELAHEVSDHDSDNDRSQHVVVALSEEQPGDGGSERSGPDETRTESPKGFSFFVAMAFTINFIIGSGFLTIPWAFAQTGILLGVLLVVILTGFAVASSVFVVEAMARAGALLNNTTAADISSLASLAHRRLHGVEYGPIDPPAISGADDADKSVHTSTDTSDNQILLPPSHPLLLVRDSKLEVTDLCSMFLGKWGLRVYTVFISLYTYGTLWAYATVFAKSFSTIFGEAVFGDFGYEVFLLVFACFGVPVSMLELTEQVGLQVTLSIWRVAMLAVMVSTLVVASLFNLESFSGYANESSLQATFAQFSPSKLYILLPIATYANIFHHSIPALSLPIKDKSQVASVFSVSLMVCMVAYILLGLSVVAYFGRDMAQASNLNWAGYRICSGHRSWFIKIASVLLSRFVVLFPACDVASAYPLNAITLGNNLMSNFLPSQTGEHQQSRRQLYLFRIAASAPPILGAYFVQDLGKITNYTGLCGCAISFVFPALLSYTSELSLKRLGLSHRTAYEKWYAGHCMRVTIFFFGVIVIIYVFVCNLLGL